MIHRSTDGWTYKSKGNLLPRARRPTDRPSGQVLQLSTRRAPAVRRVCSGGRIGASGWWQGAVGRRTREGTNGDDDDENVASIHRSTANRPTAVSQSVSATASRRAQPFWFCSRLLQLLTGTDAALYYCRRAAMANIRALAESTV